MRLAVQTMRYTTCANEEMKCKWYSVIFSSKKLYGSLRELHSRYITARVPRLMRDWWFTIGRVLLLCMMEFGLIHSRAN